jgi:N-acetylglucosamine kinase-like BadF-type ATPase
MPSTKLIADSGATKAEWCLLTGSRRKIILTQGISPYFLSGEQIHRLLLEELFPKLKKTAIDEVFYYGTGCASPVNAGIVKKAIQKTFPGSQVEVTHDLMAAARSVCGNEKGVVSILGTGSNSCYYNGRKIVKNSPGLGYVLGDEGSGSYLGKKVLQYYLYNTFDPQLTSKFVAKYKTSTVDILANVYKEPFPNRYLAGFAIFLAENRGHYMIENIIEDGLNDFFFYHLQKYKETAELPVSFVGGIAYGFMDVIQELCQTYKFELGKIIKAPMEGLIDFHS